MEIDSNKKDETELEWQYSSHHIVSQCNAFQKGLNCNTEKMDILQFSAYLETALKCMK